MGEFWGEITMVSPLFFDYSRHVKHENGPSAWRGHSQMSGAVRISCLGESGDIKAMRVDL